MSYCQIGNLQIMRALEMIMPFGRQAFFPQTTESDWAPHRHWLEPQALDPVTDELQFPMQSYVVHTSHHTILIDSCVGNDKERPNRSRWHMKTDDAYMRALAALGIAPEDIDFVMCTHLHTDHIGWNTRLEKGRWVPTFPRAKYLFHRPEFEHFMNLPDDEKPAAVLDSVVPIAEAGQAEVVDGDHSIGDGIYLEPTPGHTPGHCSVHLSSSAGEAVITGDLMHHPIQFAEPQWTTQVCTYPEQAVQTRQAFIEKYADTDTLILGTHFAPPTACRIIRRGESYRPRF